MAKLPSILPPWAAKPYGHDENAWSQARNQCRQALFGWAAAGECHYYSDLVPLISAISWPEGAYTHGGLQMGYLLGQVSLAEIDPVVDRPLLSALAISKADNMPSSGFWSLLEELGVLTGTSYSDREKFWNSELKRCFAVYGKPK
jgi:hypothetical protein